MQRKLPTLLSSYSQYNVASRENFVKFDENSPPARNFTRITVQVNSDLFLPLMGKDRFDESGLSTVFKPTDNFHRKERKK